ncbi:type II RES/Xre toxin-antitoxin system antitoxin [Nonlabens sp.]|uniref:type II RES/Xre toxin-antitoxin system antitoxin n=1 Tax=Nonlabens sp. TaxID=1888209 RepID=UPI003F6A1629
MKKYEINDGKDSKVNEAAVQYLRSFQSPIDKVKFIRSGVPFSVFMQLREEVPFSDEEWAVLLDISLKSLQRYIKEGVHVFKVIHSERILEIIEVSELGIKVFGSQENFHGWCLEAMPALNNMPPIDLMRDSYGKELVMDELHAINHGIFA